MQMAHPEIVLQYIKLPDKLENGNYDSLGQKVGPNEPASLTLYMLPGGPFPPWQCWGVFKGDLAPGQYGSLAFLNVPGSAVPGGAFTEWDRRKNEPSFTDKLMVLYSVSRGTGVARIIGRNDSAHPVAVAAGLLFVGPDAVDGAATAAPTAEKAVEATSEPAKRREPSNLKAPKASTTEVTDENAE
jgi:hypothetical protein